GATNATYTATKNGSYTISEDNGTCNTTSSLVTLTVLATPIANAGDDVFANLGESVTLNGSGGGIYSWSPGSSLNSPSVANPHLIATQTTTYTLTVSDVNNMCSSTDQMTVFVVAPIVIPNVITVNGDGVNDNWAIYNIDKFPHAVIDVYNRWGNIVWHTEGFSKNWDGTNYRNGQVLPDGTYFYIIKLNNSLYNEPYTGWVEIIK
ncbi:MAG: gliding motility-associated C-terminal domain-containing protein, partial [Cytophaga sp.]|uniref:gliding motility-associated C-terminal domain-containing protein n=1 Tax=Cytophaga sp. TaxID=29535 RepID=UPI003F81BA85